MSKLSLSPNPSSESALSPTIFDAINFESSISEVIRFVFVTIP